MKEENSKNKRMGALAIAVIMLLAIFAPASYAADDINASSDAKAKASEPTVPAAPVVKVSGIRLNHKSVTLRVGRTTNLKAVVTPSNAANKAVTWKSSNTRVATVSSKGTVTVRGAGKAAITATAGGKSVSCSINGTLSAPSGIKTKTLGNSTIQIRWNKVAGASGYKIYRSTKKSGKYKRIATVKGGTKTSYKNRKRTTGTTYYYKVMAYGGGKNSAYSKRVSGRAKPLQTKVSVKAGEEKIKVSWNKVSGAHGYHVYRATSKKGKYKRIKILKGGKTTSYTNTGLKAGKTYYYKARAYRFVKGKKVYASHSASAATKAKKVKLKKSKHGFGYKKKIKVKAYAYSGGGRTAMGTRARVGAIAVDPKVIPLGTKVYVEGYGHARAEDTGGNIKGKTVDLYMNSNGACYKWGVKYKTVYVDVRK